MDVLKKTSDSSWKRSMYAKLTMSDTGIVEVRRNKENEGKRNGRHSTNTSGYHAASRDNSGRQQGAVPKLLRVTKVTESPDSGLGTSLKEDTDGPNFDLLFHSPDKYPLGIRTPRCLSPSASFEDKTDTDVETGLTLKHVGRTDSIETETPSGRQLSRGSSFNDTPVIQLLIEHVDHSHGFGGFRRRLANDIRQKFCSFCRCDEVIFLFLYVVFGIVYMCAGTLGILNCPDENKVAYFLVIDGMLSIFVFPVTIVEWTKRIGGCMNENEKLDKGIFFITVVLMRTVAVIAGTVILVLRVQEPVSEELICVSVNILLEVGVFMEWGFLLLVVIAPLGLYCCAFVTAKAIA